MSGASGVDEEALVVAAADGSRNAYDSLVELHAPRLLAIARRMLGNDVDAQDAVQNALASAWLALPRFDTGRPFAPWITTILINKSRDAIRSRRFSSLFRFGSETEIVDLPDDEPDQERQVAANQLLAFVQSEIARLPPRLKEPFVLVTFDGRSQAETAQILGISEKAVETRIYRVRKALREKSEKFEG